MPKRNSRESSSKLQMDLFPKYMNWLKILFLSLFLLGWVPSLVLAFNPLPIKDMPETIQIKGKMVSLKDLKNPLPPSDENLRKGSEVYFKNCFLCHGDLLDGKGVFGNRFFPPPTNFRNPTH